MEKESIVVYLIGFPLIIVGADLTNRPVCYGSNPQEKRGQVKAGHSKVRFLAEAV